MQIINEESDRAITIDFGSCRKLGESLENVGRTFEWYDGKVQKSLPENDLNALEEICIWLGLSSKSFNVVGRLGTNSYSALVIKSTAKRYTGYYKYMYIFMSVTLLTELRATSPSVVVSFPLWR